MAEAEGAVAVVVVEEVDSVTVTVVEKSALTMTTMAKVSEEVVVAEEEMENPKNLAKSIFLVNAVMTMMYCLEVVSKLELISGKIFFFFFNF